METAAEKKHHTEVKAIAKNSPEIIAETPISKPKIFIMFDFAIKNGTIVKIK